MSQHLCLIFRLFPLLALFLSFPLFLSGQSLEHTWRSFSTAEEAKDIQHFLDAFEQAQDLHPELLPQMFRRVDLLHIQSVQGFRKEMNSKLLRRILIAQKYLGSRDTANRAFWYKEKALTVFLYRDWVADSVAPNLRSALEYAPAEMPFLFVSGFAEAILKQAEDSLVLPELISAFGFVDNLQLQAERLFPERIDELREICLRIASKLQESCPDCHQLREKYGVLVNQNLLSPSRYGELYTMLRLRGCRRDALRDTVLNRVASVGQSSYHKRIAAAEYLEQEAYFRAQRLLESCLQASDDKQLQAMDCLRLANVFQQQKEFRTARIYAMRANEHWPDWGKPWLFMADMVQRSAPFCEFSPMERKALNWLAIDYCEQARNQNPKLFHQAQKRIDKYEKAMPTRQELRLRGLQMGDSFPLRCWLELATRVRY